MNIEQNISLKTFNTFHSGGAAAYFARIRNEEDLREALTFIKEKQLPFFVLGNGSNILVPDEGYRGFILKMEMKGVVFEEKENGIVRAIAAAGEDWNEFVLRTVEKELSGVENLAYIPSTVGAVPVQNIGAYGTEAKDTIAWVEAIHSETGEKKIFSAEECAFGYRESFFKTSEGKKYIITRVAFDLKKNGMLKTNYKDVQEYFSARNISSPKIRDVYDAIVEIRAKKLPDISKDFTAGSFFKNIVLPEEQADELLKKYPNMAVYPAGEGMKKIAAAWVLDHLCGARGMQKGNVGTYKNQALVVVNNGQATTKEILDFASSLEMCVKEKINVALEREVELLKNK